MENSAGCRATVISCLNHACGQKNRLEMRRGVHNCSKCGELIVEITRTDCPYLELVLEQGTAKWKQWRTGGFGASDMPVLMRKSPWKSVEKLLKEKRGYDDGYENDAMREGRALEPVARREYCKVVGFDVSSPCLQHFDYPWARASLDGISSDRKKVVEIKCGKGAYSQAKDGKIPRYYYAQLQHILFVTGLDMIDYWCYRPGQSGILQKRSRNDSYIESLIEKGEEFKDRFE